MERLNDTCRRVTWIDHHKTAIDAHTAGEYPLFSNWVLDSNFAACELTWQYLYWGTTGHPHGSPLPDAVHYLGRYDIWKHAETPGALEFQYGMRLQEDTLPGAAIWAELLVAPGKDTYASLNAQSKALRIKQIGKTCLAYERQQNAKFISAYGFYTELDGLKCIAANRGMSNSLLFESVWNHEMYDAMLMFAWKNGQWTISLYTDKPGIDVSKVAKARGGGGHVGAAGFQCKELPF
jgi:uncharacterized protein